MKLELDFTEKTIKILEPVSIAEIFDFLNQIPNIREWKLIPEENKIPPYPITREREWVPYPIYPEQPYNPYPYPIITYTGDNPAWDRYETSGGTYIFTI